MSEYRLRTIHGFPRSALIGTGAILAMSIALAGFGRMTGMAHDTPVSTPVLSRQLLFSDQANGGVMVADARDPATPIAIMAPGTNGFLRATLRGLASERKHQVEGTQFVVNDIPFRLTAWADGRLTLEDPSIGRKVEMEAFGITNEQVFASLLTAKGPVK
jgi:putative photosynthetic complex assembly protein